MHPRCLVCTPRPCLPGVAQPLSATPPSNEAVGGAFWALGAAGVVLTLLGVIDPPRISLILGSAIALAGPALADIQTMGKVWGLLTGAGLAAAGVWRRRVELLIIGALGVVGYAIALVYRLVGDDLGAATTLLLSGLIMVAGALVTARLAGVGQRPLHDPTSASGVTNANATSEPPVRDQHDGRQP